MALGAVTLGTGALAATITSFLVPPLVPVAAVIGAIAGLILGTLFLVHRSLPKSDQAAVPSQGAAATESQRIGTTIATNTTTSEKTSTFLYNSTHCSQGQGPQNTHQFDPKHGTGHATTPKTSKKTCDPKTELLKSLRLHTLNFHPYEKRDVLDVEIKKSAALFVLQEINKLDPSVIKVFDPSFNLEDALTFINKILKVRNLSLLDNLDEKEIIQISADCLIRSKEEPFSRAWDTIEQRVRDRPLIECDTKLIQEMKRVYPALRTELTSSRQEYWDAFWRDFPELPGDS